MPTLIGTKLGSYGGSVSYGDKRYVRRYSRVYSVLADNSTQDALTIAETVGLPSIGSIWTSGTDYDTGARLISIEPQPVGDSDRLWEVTCTWDSTTKQDDEKSSSPEDRTPEWEWSYETIAEQLQRDRVDFNPVENSIGEPLFVDTEIAIAVLTITRFKATFNRTEIFDYVNRVNSEPFWGAAPGSVLMAGITDRLSNTRGTDGTNYREVTYTLKFHQDADGWLVKVLDSGTKYRTAGGVVMTFVDDNQNPTIGKLDGAGGKLVDPAPDVFLEFNRFETANFNDLKLGPDTWA